MPIKPVSGEIKAQVINDNNSYLDGKINQVNGGPKETFNNLAALQAKYPKGDNSAMLVLEADGKTAYLYTWSGTAWVKGALYQAAGIADKSVTNSKIADNEVDDRTISTDLTVSLAGVSKGIESMLTASDQNTIKLESVFHVWESIEIINGEITGERYTDILDYVGGGAFPKPFADEAQTFTFRKKSAGLGINSLVAVSPSAAWGVALSTNEIRLARFNKGANSSVTLRTIIPPVPLAAGDIISTIISPDLIDIVINGVSTTTYSRSDATLPDKDLIFANRRIGTLALNSRDINTTMDRLSFNITHSIIPDLDARIESTAIDLTELEKTIGVSNGINFVNDDILLNQGTFSIVDGNLSGRSGPNTYNWMTFDMAGKGDIITYKSTVAGGWPVMLCDGEEAIAFCTYNNGTQAVLVRRFTKDGRVDLATIPATMSQRGDYIKVERTDGYTYNAYKRAEPVEPWVKMFTINLETILTPEEIAVYEDDMGMLTTNVTATFCEDIRYTESGTTLVNRIETLEEKIDNIDPEDTKKKKYYLIMMMGQSNMAGRGVASQAPTVPDKHGYEFRAVSDPNRLYPISEPFGVNENRSGLSETTKTGSLVSAFANAFYDLTGSPAICVSASKGGTSISQWHISGNLLPDAKQRFIDAEAWLLANNYEIAGRYMVWCQGETDGTNGTSAADYTARLKAIIAEMKSLGIEKCFNIRIGNRVGDNVIHKVVIDAQTEMAKTDPDFIMISTCMDRMASDGLMKSGGIHYSQPGYNITGTQAGENLAFYVNNRKEPTMYDWNNSNLYFSYK